MTFSKHPAAASIFPHHWAGRRFWKLYLQSILGSSWAHISVPQPASASPAQHTGVMCIIKGDTLNVPATGLSGVVAPQRRHLLEACCTKSCKLIGMVLHSISLCRRRRAQPVTGSPPATSFTPCHVSRRVIDTSCPKYQKSLGFLPVVCLQGSVGVNQEMIVLTLAEYSSAKTRKCSALHLNHKFWQEQDSLSGLASKDEYNIRGKLLRNFYYLQAWILPGPKFRTWTSFANATMPLSIMNTDSGFVFVSQWYWRGVMAKYQLRGKTASLRLTDTIVPSSQAPLELGTCDGERMGGNHTIQACTISSLSLGSVLEGPQWDNSQFPLVICQT